MITARGGFGCRADQGADRERPGHAAETSCLGARSHDTHPLEHPRYFAGVYQMGEV